MDKRSHDERAKNGLQTRREVLGAEYVDKAMAGVDEFSAEFTDLLNTYCWNDIWNRPGLPRKMRSVLNLGADNHSWRPPIVKTVAHRGDGVDDVLAAVANHRAMLSETGGLELRRARRARDEVEAIAVTALRERFGDLHGHADLDSLATEVASGGLDPYAAADRLLGAL